MDDWDPPIEDVAGSERIEEGTSILLESGGKDELNLAEFPIAALTDRIPDGQTTLVFEDRLERPDSPPIVRRLTIMGTHKHGLPTSLDDEVLVGLIQLTKRRSNFTNAKVQFSRYELIELLGWPQSGQSYKRIEEALHRWVGVVLMYENAWWDNLAKSWVDENFHVLDNVTLYDRERRRPPSRSGKTAKAEKAPLPLSSFRWNEVIFQSFQSGNLKQLDLEFYLRLRLPTTKRMFRFLDKRFYRRSRLDFDLRTMACEHIGMSRSYAPTELKRRLKPALEELEQNGFLEPLSPEERYSYVKRGCWRIILIRGKAAQASSEPDESGAASAEDGTSELVELLTARGVTSKIAAELVESHPEGRIRTKIDVFDWLSQNQDKRIGKNPAGYLVASIRADYQAPGDFPSQEKPQGSSKRSSSTPKAREEAAKKATRSVEQSALDESEQVREAELRAAWESLPEAEREAIMTQVKLENPGLGRWKKLLEPYCFDVMEKRLSGGKSRVAQKSLFPEVGADA